MHGTKPPQSRMETLVLTPDIVNEWQLPPFQRELRVNAKVRQIAAELTTNGGVISGTITLGMIEGSQTIYLIDGQHRVEAFKISALNEGIASVRSVVFHSMSEMGVEFVTLNTAIVRLKPDDVMRGLEESLPCLQRIRNSCPFIGYDHIRRRPTAPLVSMSSALRCWRGSAGEIPVTTGVGPVAQFASEITVKETEHFIHFMTIASTAWGADPEYGRLWSNLNLLICMWLWRRLVLDIQRGGSRAGKKYAVLSTDEFRRCLMSVSSNRLYIDWLLGRINDRDRSPCYGRLKKIFAERMHQDGWDRPLLPAPPWASNLPR
jgi:hypothetical protein